MSSMEGGSISELRKEGRVYVTYPTALRDAVLKAEKSWEEFCSLPLEQKLKFAYDTDTLVSGNGYEYKRKANGDFDDKENVHLRVANRNSLLERAGRVGSPLAIKFVEDALAINELMAPIVQAFARAVEKDCDIPNFEKDVMDRQAEWLIRYLHYFGDQESGSEIAAAHIDKGGFTLHLYESDSGVERLTFDTREWVSMPLSHDQTVIIAGSGLQNRSQGKLRAVSHRVVANSDTAKRGRFSAVCFFTINNNRLYNKQKFGSLQKFPPGFFYDMPFEEFDTYFTDKS